jgi:hypothetical protein
MPKYFKLITFTLSVGLMIGAGTFETARYINHHNRDAFRLLSADSQVPVYHFITSIYSPDSSRMNYSYSNSRY